MHFRSCTETKSPVRGRALCGSECGSVRFAPRQAETEKAQAEQRERARLGDRGDRPYGKGEGRVRGRIRVCDNAGKNNGPLKLAPAIAPPDVTRLPEAAPHSDSIVTVPERVPPSSNVPDTSNAT
jgi:hypothetical protein